MNSRNNPRCFVLLFLSAVVAVCMLLLLEGSVFSQEARQRSPDLIRELYDAGPTRHWLPTLAEGPAPAAESEPETPFPSWSKLAFFSFRNDNWDIYLVDPDGTDEVRLTSGSSTETYPWLKAGCDRVVFASDRDGNNEIYAVNADGSDLQRLTFNNKTDTMPAWSLDGTRIAFQSYRTGNSDIFVMNADGSNPIQLTDSTAYDGQPSWSPDGTEIVFTSNRSGGYELWIMNADGSNEHQVTASGSALYPSWSPRGNKIAYASDSNGDGWLEIWQMNADGSAPQGLYSSGSNNTDLWGPAWSPDGKWLATIETTWTLYKGQWYWTRSFLRLSEVGGYGSSLPLSDNRVWKAHWATTDTSPPGPCTLSVPAERRWSPFVMSWSAEDVGPAGLGSYDVQVRTSAAAPWQEFISGTPYTAGIYPGDDVGHLEFRCRARDRGGNQANWEDGPLFSTIVDAARPRSQVSPLPRYVRGSSVPVQWTGSDEGSRIGSYDVLVRDGTGGDWQVWQDGVSATSALFSGTPGHTYYFRSQARDVAGHVEPWQPSPQAVTTMYSYVLSGTVTDQRGYSGLVAAIHMEPPLAFQPPDPSSGAYGFYGGEVASYTLEVSAMGYGILPPTELYLAQDARFDLVLPPEDEAVTNGGFESGGLDGWSVSGDGAQVTVLSRHTGAYGLQIGHEVAATTELSQTVVLSQALHQPTLSLMYQLPSDLAGGAFSVRVAGRIGGATDTTVVQTSAASQGWAHAWADLSEYAGQTVTLTLDLDSAVGTVEVDEVWIGSWQTPVVESVSPAEWPGYEAPGLTILGQNLIGTPAVFLDGIELDNVTWVSTTMLTADALQGLADGLYDLTVVNPNGSATTLPDAVTVTWQRALLPVVARDVPPGSLQGGGGWPTLSHDVRHSGYNDAEPGASRYALVYSTTLPFASTGETESVVVADGIVVASNGSPDDDAAVVALDAETGSEIWRVPFSGKFSINPPSIAYGAVYFQEANGGTDSYLFCVDLYAGAQHWQAPFYRQRSYHLAPIVVDEEVYAEVGDGGMRAYDAGTGRSLWVINMEFSEKWTPAYADGKLYTWIAGMFRAHSPATGEVLWAVDFGWDGLGYGIDTTPVIAGQTAIVASYEGLYAINLSTHGVRWTVDGNYDATIPAIANGVVYALKNGMLEARRLSDGGLLWGFAGDGNLKHAPVVTGEYVYVASGANTYVLNRTTHQVEWQTGHGGWLAIADGLLYIAQPDETIYAYRAQEP